MKSTTYIKYYQSLLLLPSILVLPLVLSLLFFLPWIWSLGVVLVIEIGLLFPKEARIKRILTEIIYSISCLILLLCISWVLGINIGSVGIGQLLYLVFFIAGKSIQQLIRQFFTPKERGPKTICCRLLRSVALRREVDRFERIFLLFSLLGCALLILVIFGLGNTLFITLITISLSGLSWIILALEIYYLHWILVRLEKEIWIPVLDIQGKPISCVPLASPRTDEGLLPLVRLIVFSQGMIYLEQGERTIYSTPDKYDTPFVHWQNLDTNPRDEAQQLIDQRLCGIKRISLPQPISYQKVIQEQGLWIYLFAVEIESPQLLHIDCNPIQGKWYPLQELLPQIHQGKFSSFIQEEIPLLEQTILLAQRLRKRN